MEKIRIKYLTPSMEIIQTEPVRLLEESLPVFEDEISEISDPTEIE